MNYHDIVTEFSDFMRGYGIETNVEIIADGKINRAYVIGDKRGSKNLSYLLHTDGKPAGYFEHFRTGERVRWKSNAVVGSMSHEQRAEIAAKKLQREKDALAKYQQAAMVARKLWTQAQPFAIEQTHAYLLKKRILPHNARILSGDLLIALWNERREISTLQFVDPQGDKRFLVGGKKAGAFAVIGKHDAPHNRILICEGFATGASLFEDTGHFVVCAMDAGNLEPVARAIRRLFTVAPITICGDNDLTGVGQKAAKSAALACNGGYIIPPDVGTDWNDVISEDG